MLKNLPASKNQITTFLLIAVFVIGKTLVSLLNQGNPGVLGLIICIAMSVLFLLFFFNKFPSTKEELFTGDGLVRLVGALIIIFWSFSESYLVFDYNIAMVVLPVMIFCASDTRFMPVNVIVALGMAIRFAAIGFVAVPCAFFVSFILVAPKLKAAKTWEKIVFAAAQLCLVIDFIYMANQLRFMFTLTSVTANIAINIFLALFAVFYIMCMVSSLKKQKTFKSKKTSKVISVAKKPEYTAALGYLVISIFALSCTALDARYSMSALVGIIMSTLIVCKNGTPVEDYADKAAKLIGGFIDKIPDEKTPE